MSKPPLGTRILDHPPVCLPIFGIGAFVLYQCTQDSSNWPLAMGAISAAMRASEQAEAYRDVETGLGRHERCPGTLRKRWSLPPPPCRRQPARLALIFPHRP